MFITRSIERNRSLITKVYFPRMILPMAALAPGLIIIALLFVVITFTVGYYRYTRGIWYITVHPGLLVALAAVVLTLLFTVAIGLFTSVLQARYPDLRMGLRYALPFWFWLTPIAYPLDQFPEKYRWLAALNPLTHVVEAFKWGTIAEGRLDIPGLVTSVVLIFATIFVGVWYFNREEAASIDKL
jgi:lipopolysaccharide transport system permease protein